MEHMEPWSYVKNRKQLDSDKVGEGFSWFQCRVFTDMKDPELS